MFISKILRKNKLVLAALLPCSLLFASQALAENWTLQGSDIYNSNNGNVGIGTAAPLSHLDISVGSSNTDGISVHGGGNLQSLLLQPSAVVGAFIAGATAPDGTNNGNNNDSAGRIIMQGSVNSGMQFQYSNSAAVGAARTWTTGFVLGTGAYAGNVGIGVATPAQALDVAGNIKLSGSLVSDGDICIGACP